MLPDSARKDRNTVVLQINLATIIARWSYVKSVHVIIDKGRRQRIVGSATPPATASVAIESNGRYSAKKLAHAAAAFISGSVDRLKPENVSVVIDGNHIPIMSNDDMGDQEYLAVKKEYEDHQRKKIADLMPPGSMVQVNVKWNNADQTVNTREYNEKTSWLAVTETMALEDTSNVSERQEEPGLIANVSSPAGGSGNRQEQSTDESKATKKPYAGVVETIERRRQGGIKDVTATVRVPEEYYSEMARNGGEQEPDQAIVNALIAQELSDLKEVVMATIGFPKGEGEDRVFVDTYWAGGKVAATDATDSTQNTGAVGTITNMASRYGKHIAVSALAMISLFMALMMVRKTVGPVDLSEEEAAAMLNNPPLDAQGFGDSQIDDGSGNDALLSGMELDDKSIRSQQMLEQIREMVTDSPEITSELVSKWISQDI